LLSRCFRTTAVLLQLPGLRLLLRSPCFLFVRRNNEQPNTTRMPAYAHTKR